MAVLLLEAAWPRLSGKCAGAVRPAEPSKRPSPRPRAGTLFIHSLLARLSDAWRQRIYFSARRWPSGHRSKPSKRGLSEPNIKRALEIERSFEKHCSSVEMLGPPRLKKS